MGFGEGSRREVDWEDVIEDIDALKELIERVRDTPAVDRAEDFLDDVEASAEDMRERISADQRATPGQERTVHNWTTGVRKWLRD